LTPSLAPGAPDAGPSALEPQRLAQLREMGVTMHLEELAALGAGINQRADSDEKATALLCLLAVVDGRVAAAACVGLLSSPHLEDAVVALPSLSPGNGIFGRRDLCPGHATLLRKLASAASTAQQRELLDVLGKALLGGVRLARVGEPTAPAPASQQRRHAPPLLIRSLPAPRAQVDAHADDPLLPRLTVDAVLRIRAFRDADNHKICDFVRSLLFGVGKDRMALNTMWRCVRAQPLSLAPRAATPRATTPRSRRRNLSHAPLVRSWAIWYGTRMWAAEYYGANMSGMRFDDDKGGMFLDTLQDLHDYAGRRVFQILRGPMHCNMVRSAQVDKGVYRHTDFTQDEQRERWLFPCVPTARTFDNRKALAAPPLPGTAAEPVEELVMSLVGKRGRVPKVPEEAAKRYKAASPGPPALFLVEPELPP